MSGCLHCVALPANIEQTSVCRMDMSRSDQYQGYGPDRGCHSMGIGEEFPMYYEVPFLPQRVYGEVGNEPAFSIQGVFQGMMNII